MNITPQASRTQLPVVQNGDRQVVAAYKAAINAETDYALKAIICGQLLVEKRAELRHPCHSDKGLPNSWYKGNKDTDSKFGLWAESRGISQRKAYRWMEAADRVMRLQLGLQVHEALPATIDIDVDGVVVPLSQALTAPEAELTAAALKFRQGVFGFMADKTLSEAVSAAVGGESPGHRITRAGAGKMAGGAGDNEQARDRKAFERFISNKVREITSLLTVGKNVRGADILHERKLTGTQKAVIISRFISALEVWPRWLVDALVEKGKVELKTSDVERAGRGNPFRGRKDQ